MKEEKLNYKTLEKARLIHELEKRDVILEEARLEMEIADFEKMNWIGLPVVLQDLGFKHYMKPETEELPPINIYYKGNVACFKNSDNLWEIVRGNDEKIVLNLPTKFHAYQIFTMMGMTFEVEDSTAHFEDMDIQDFLDKMKLSN